MISHETALATHEIGEFEARHVHMTVPLGFRKDHDALMLHKANLLDEDVEVREGYRITTIVRSLIDVASLAPDNDQLARAIEEARERGRFTLRRLRSEAERVNTRGALFIERALPLVIERG